jgi:hypothetical protein
VRAGFGALLAPTLAKVVTGFGGRK